MKDAKSRGASGAKAERTKRMTELAMTAKHDGGGWAAEELKLMIEGKTAKKAERIVQGKAEAAMAADAEKFRSDAMRMRGLGSHNSKTPYGSR